MIISRGAFGSIDFNHVKMIYRRYGNVFAALYLLPGLLQ